MHPGQPTPLKPKQLSCIRYARGVTVGEVDHGRVGVFETGVVDDGCSFGHVDGCFEAVFIDDLDGGWRIAQEEALCYRSSLSLSLNPKEYPLGTNDALYSPYVVIIRSALGDGHQLLHNTVPVKYLPAVSVLTVAAIHQPETQSFTVQSRANNTNTSTTTGGQLPPIKRVFAHNRERNLTKDKMRLVLRMAATHGHSALVLGALGCGAFANPPEDVAHCWLEVLREDEFSGNWWREVCFAVYDPKDEGNYDIFKVVLEGKEV